MLHFSNPVFVSIVNIRMMGIEQPGRTVFTVYTLQFTLCRKYIIYTRYLSVVWEWLKFANFATQNALKIANLHVARGNQPVETSTIHTVSTESWHFLLPHEPITVGKLWWTVWWAVCYPANSSTVTFDRSWNHQLPFVATIIPAYFSWSRLVSVLNPPGPQPPTKSSLRDDSSEK